MPSAAPTVDLTVGTNGIIPCAEVQNGANKNGAPAYDRPHNFKLAAAYVRPIGPINLTFGALTEALSKFRHPERAHSQRVDCREQRRSRAKERGAITTTSAGRIQSTAQSGTSTRRSKQRGKSIARRRLGSGRRSSTSPTVKRSSARITSSGVVLMGNRLCDRARELRQGDLAWVISRRPRRHRAALVSLLAGLPLLSVLQPSASLRLPEQVEGRRWIGPGRHRRPGLFCYSSELKAES